MGIWGGHGAFRLSGIPPMADFTVSFLCCFLLFLYNIEGTLFCQAWCEFNGIIRNGNFLEISK